MKFNITIVLTCVIFSLYAQEKYNDPLYPESNTVNVTNFKIDNGSLVWQKIYESKLTPTAIVKKLKADGKIKNIDFSENLLTGELNIPADYKNAGFSEMSTPMYISRNDILCSVTINFKENRYRVTLKNIRLKTTQEDPLSKVGETANLDSYALKKKNSEFKAQFLNVPGKIYDYTFNQVFEIETKTEDDNW